MPEFMATRQAVVLGARFGGLAVVTWLRRVYSPGTLDIVVIDRWEETIYRPGLVHAMTVEPLQVLPPVRMAMAAFWKRHHVQFIHDTVTGLDPQRRQIYTVSHSPISYGVLFVTTGSDPGWDTVDGLGPHRGGICEGYLARQTSSNLTPRPPKRMVFAAGMIHGNPAWTPQISVGCECPLLESALLWEDRLRRSGLREDADIVVLTPAATIAESAGAQAQQWLRQAFSRRGIRVITGASYKKVTDSEVILADRRIAYDGSLWIPPYIGASWLEGSAIEDGYGWIPTDSYLNHPDYPDIYAVGDVVSHPWPKMGHSAMVQARIAVRHWHAVQTRRPLPMPYHPELLWAMETGRGRGLFVQSDVFYGGTREIVHSGYWPWAAKQAFQKTYVSLRGAFPLMP